MGGVIIDHRVLLSLQFLNNRLHVASANEAQTCIPAHQQPVIIYLQPVWVLSYLLFGHLPLYYWLDIQALHPLYYYLFCNSNTLWPGTLNTIIFLEHLFPRQIY